jgi:hypothetical protein
MAEHSLILTPNARMHLEVSTNVQSTQKYVVISFVNQHHDA